METKAKVMAYIMCIILFRTISFITALHEFIPCTDPHIVHTEEQCRVLLLYKGPICIMPSIWNILKQHFKNKRSIHTSNSKLLCIISIYTNPCVDFPRLLSTASSCSSSCSSLYKCCLVKIHFLALVIV